MIAAALASALVTHAAMRDGPVERRLDSKIESVVLYQGRAAITRVATAELDAGLWKLQFDGLPASIEPDTLEAKTSLGAILSVDYSARATPDASASTEAEALDRRVRDAEALVATDEAVLSGFAAEARIIDSVGVRAANDASAEAGTAKLDLPALEAQLKWIAAQRVRIQESTRAGSTALAAHRSELDALRSRRAALGAMTGSAQGAEVLLALSEPASISLRLSYLVSGARWEPVYAMRASPETGKVAVEIDAVVVQASGEPWEGVRLSLSTARPTHASRPPKLDPWFVDVIVERTPRSPVERNPSGMASGFAEMEDALQKGNTDREPVLASPDVSRAIEEPAKVGGSGPNVTYTIALPFDAPSDAQVRRRARIASFEAATAFVHQAQPAVADGAYLRGRLVNTSAFQMLPGRASVFVNADFVGAMPFSGAAPKQEFDVYFGVDPAVTVTRTLVSREDRASGLFGGGLDSVSEYRTNVVNGTGRSITLELLDFRPVSRSGKVEVAIPSTSVPLSSDPVFVASERPRGILRWDLSVPATPTGGDGLTVSWTVIVSRSKDIEITPLPER